ncbi:acyl-CoA/acyl-ACP dehydrogenase [Streptomyces sp. KM273126]|uniref:acyl-CoA dehydrogenase family protein n=1 Tax=Streptomyces sp. KM273126 TaxID=2545247 RepID=UPI0010400BEF|nr:acyl-CoA dehydrogenase family protein [Streptomyces sp. KM273126]MBA2807008.1 acyl-CoA/acyl-ACP dehydrogenase [Streptomyces sp. KM273126]
MDARFTAEQEEIRRTVREVLLKRCGPEEVRAALRTDDGYDGGLWTTFADQLGLPGLALPEEYGGIGCSATELALAGEELGRALTPSPFLATCVVVAPLLLALGTQEQRADLLPRLAGGRATATLAVPGPRLGDVLGLTGDNRGDWAGGGRAGGVQARRADGGWRLYGQVEQVLDGHSAELLVVAAHTGGYARSRTLLFTVRAPAEGLTRVRQTSLDETRPRARLELRNVAAELLGRGEETGDVLQVLAGTGDTVAAVLAAEAVGAAGRALERTVAYVRQREQFGRPIGSFQAVKHRLADVYVRVQAARSAAYYAAWATAHKPGTPHTPVRPHAPVRPHTPGTTHAPDTADPAHTTPTVPGERVGGLALAQALEALRVAAAEGIQLHGGIGFTWEDDAHLYFKRAAGDELLFGPVHRLRAHAADAARLFEDGEVAV